jgi:hypothetical protein
MCSRPSSGPPSSTGSSWGICGADLPLLAQALSFGLGTRLWPAPDTATIAAGAAYLSADRARSAHKVRRQASVRSVMPVARPAAPAPDAFAPSTRVRVEVPAARFRSGLVAAAAAIAVLVGGAAVSAGGHDSGPSWHAMR